jgi:hypothetical protein
MPSAVLAFFVPGAGEIRRYLVTAAADLLATAVGLSLVAVGVLLWQALTSRAATAVRAAAASRGARGLAARHTFTLADLPSLRETNPARSNAE